MLWVKPKPTLSLHLSLMHHHQQRLEHNGVRVYLFSEAIESSEIFWMQEAS